MLVPLAFVLAQANSQVDAAYGVLQRTIGPRAREFRLELLKSEGPNDVFEVEASRGRVTVRGTTGVAICRGAYEYLKGSCNSFVSWEGSNINLPASWSNSTLRRTQSPVQFRHYYNICTFGYTTAFWDWKRWEREIDWMALHGINMPLAMTGQDKVWQTVFRSYGVPQPSIDAFFSGPAFQPWHWMGNLNGHMGPAPQSWLAAQADLQKKILGRERSLGMKPVVPGFSGFVPVDFAKYQPQVKLQSPTAWAGFQPTTFVDIRDPMFVDIGKKFVEEYRKEYGTDHYYLCDTFNEQNPQFPAETKYEDLANAGRAVYEGLRAGDPDAVWIMQGWLFYNERHYWGQKEVEALLSKVPDGRMIILDLSGEQFEVWRAQPAVAKKGFIYNTLHNFGQNTALGGDLQGYVDKQYKAFKDAAANGKLVGFGLTPEGIDQNPIVYELMCDAMWVDYPIDLSSWLNNYCRSRYGDLVSRGLAAAPPGHRAAKVGDLAGWQEIMPAWHLLHEAVYSKDAPWWRDAWRARPGRGKRGRPIAQMRQLELAIGMMLSASGELGKNPLYQRDLVDVCKTWLGGIADRQAYAAMLAWQDLPSACAMIKSDFFETLDDMDRLLATRPEHRLSTWIAQAKKWGTTPEEKALFERNARMQVTAWDGKGILTDYANKEWAGLTKDFLARRWQKHFEDLSEKNPTPMLAFEMSWVNSATPPEESKPGNPVRTVEQIYAKYKGVAEKLEAALGTTDPPGNLARAGQASDDGHTEPGGSPQNAIDGDLDTYWAASPSPCEWKLDLGAEKAFKTVHVFPYWGDGRYYQYTVEASRDGQTWTRIVDMSRNEQPSSLSGHKHVLTSAVNARFVRILVSKNSANIGVHLVEVRLFE